MKRSAKNYLCILFTAAALSFTAASIIKAHELQAYSDESSQPVSSEINQWYWAAAGSGTAGAALLAWLVLSRANEKSAKEVFASSQAKGILTLAAAGGLAIGYAGSTGMLGQLGRLDLPAVKTVSLADAAPVQETQPEEQDVEVTADSYPVADEADDDQNETKLKDIKAIPGEGILSISDTQELYDAYESSEAGKSAILVEKDGNVTMMGYATKTGSGVGDGKSLSEGANAVLYVDSGGNLAVLGASIESDGEEAPAITSQGGTVTVSDSILTTQYSQSELFFSAAGGQIKGSGIQANTQGDNSPVIIADQTGTISMEASTFATYGAGSALASGSGTMILNNCGAVLQNAPLATLKGNGSLRWDYSSVTLSSTGGILQFAKEISDSAQSSSSKATMSLTGSYINQMATDAGAGGALLQGDHSSADVLLCGNIITLPSGQLTNLTASQLNLVLDGQTVEGKVQLDNDSSASISLKNGAVLSTAINPNHSDGKVSLELDASSSLYLIGDCYVDSFTNGFGSNGNISFNGFHIYVNGEVIAS